MARNRLKVANLAYSYSYKAKFTHLDIVIGDDGETVSGFLKTTPGHGVETVNGVAVSVMRRDGALAETRQAARAMLAEAERGVEALRACVELFDEYAEPDAGTAEPRPVVPPSPLGIDDTDIPL